MEQHQQNGAAESLNRVLIDKLHLTMLAANLNKKWWPEILKTVNYLCNLSPSSVTGKTSYEGWYGNKPNLSYLCIIGCTGLAKKKEAGKRKLIDTKTICCKLLGYNRHTIYRLLIKDGQIL